MIKSILYLGCDCYYTYTYVQTQTESQPVPIFIDCHLVSGGKWILYHSDLISTN